MKTLASNKRATFDYDILEEFEAGLVLKGYEVKSIKTGRMSLRGSYVTIKDREAYLLNAHVPAYQPKNTPESYDPDQTRKLLLKKRELKRLVGKIKERGLTLVPLRVYNNKSGRLKLEFGVGKGRRKPDKREMIKKREAERKIGRAVRGRIE